ncbi:MAG: DNA recombination protein RmuC [Acidobacteria bacterium]|nr:DNA recombination protein RmuC [Acidobacteriota bacterium]
MLVTVLSAALGALAGAAVVLVLWLRDRAALAADSARLAAEREAAIRAVEHQRVELAERQAQLRDAFAALSRAALRENRQDFLENAQAIITPVRETLDRVERHLSDVDRAREGSFQAVASQLGLLQLAQEQLRSTAEGLSRSLGSPNVRGAWGEIQLRRIVELAGMLPFCDFVEKQSLTSDAGARQTPDLIVRLPGDATIVVDSKVPIQAYRDAVNASDPAIREQGFAAHIRQVRDHIRALGAKEYWRQFQPAPDFVVMFLPLEPLLSAAFERDEALFDVAAAQRVIPATPMTLLALLKAVASGWRQQQLARNAEEIQQLGRDLYERLATMIGHLEDVGRNIRQAGESYDRFVGSLEHKVLPSARRFKDLGVTSTKSLQEIEPLHVAVRAVVKPELAGRDDVDLLEAALGRDDG